MLESFSARGASPPLGPPTGALPLDPTGTPGPMAISADGPFGPSTEISNNIPAVHNNS